MFTAPPTPPPPPPSPAPAEESNGVGSPPPLEGQESSEASDAAAAMMKGDVEVVTQLTGPADDEQRLQGLRAPPTDEEHEGPQADPLSQPAGITARSASSGSPSATASTSAQDTSTSGPKGQSRGGLFGWFQ